MAMPERATLGRQGWGRRCGASGFQIISASRLMKHPARVPQARPRSKSVAWERAVKRTVAAVWAAALVGVVGCSSPQDGNEEILVFAAASLGHALGEIEAAYESRGRWRVAVSYGASQALAQQIASGAPADMFVSAGEFPVRFLDEGGLLDTVRVDLLTNKLVVAVRSASDIRLASVDDLGAPWVRRVAVADPRLAPAGRYARDSLVELGLWDGLQPKLVFGQDVRATLAFVESGNVDAALVYATDAMAATTVEALDIVPADSYPRIVYPVALVKASRQKEGASDFLDFLRGSEALLTFAKYGFEPARQ